MIDTQVMWITQDCLVRLLAFDAFQCRLLNREWTVESVNGYRGE